MKFRFPLNPNPKEEDLFGDEEDLNVTEVMEAMTGMVKIQQQGALDLTKLVLEHCKEQPFTKEYVFKVFGEALQIVKSQLGRDDE